MTELALYQLLSLLLLVLLAQWLAERTAARHIGAGLLAIIFGAIAANSGMLPTGTDPQQPVALYDFIFGYLAPLSIFWLLLQVNLSEIRRAGPAMLGLFALGAAGTVVGVIVALQIFQGAGTLRGWEHPVGGALAGTYTGGSLNFNAVALHYGLQHQGALYGGIIAADNIITAVWMAATLAAPRLLLPLWHRMATPDPAEPHTPAPSDDSANDGLTAVLITITLGVGALWLTQLVQPTMPQVPSMLLLSALALGLAQLPTVNRLAPAQTFGMLAVYVFLAVIGTHCDLAALRSLGAVGIQVFALTTLVVLIHGLCVFGGARLLKLDLVSAAVASQANIGGAATALAVARSAQRSDLVLPAVLIGTLGTASGSFIGFLVAQQLLPAVI